MEDYCKYLLENWKILSLGSSAILNPANIERKTQEVFMAHHFKNFLRFLSSYNDLIVTVSLAVISERLKTTELVTI